MAAESPDDMGASIRAYADQLEATMANDHARIVASYYRSLVERGMPSEAALALTRDVQATLLERAEEPPVEPWDMPG